MKKSFNEVAAGIGKPLKDMTMAELTLLLRAAAADDDGTETKAQQKPAARLSQIKPFQVKVVLKKKAP